MLADLWGLPPGDWATWAGSVAVSVSLIFLALDSRRRIYLDESAQAREVAAWLDTIDDNTGPTLLRTMTIDNASKSPLSSVTGYVLELLSDDVVATFKTLPKVPPHESAFHYYVSHHNQQGLYLILVFYDEAGVLWRKYDYLSASYSQRKLWRRRLRLTNISRYPRDHLHGIVPSSANHPEPLSPVPSPE